MKSEMALKKAFVLLSFVDTACRPLYASWYMTVRYATQANAYKPQPWASSRANAAKRPVKIMTTSANISTRMLAPFRPAMIDKSTRRRGVVRDHYARGRG